MFYRNRQLLLLTLLLVITWGLSSLLTLPRLEDPEIVQRNSTITTFLPGASPDRVEALITEKIETELQELEEISAITSTSSSGISVINVEIKDEIRDIDPVWSKVRSKLDDAVPLLPPDASAPEYRDAKVSANALIVGLAWTLDDRPNLAILQRLAEDLSDQLRAIPGTDSVETFGDAPEEIRIEIAAPDLARLGLDAAQLAAQIRASDAKVSAGQFRSETNELLFELDSELDSIERIRQIPIQVAGDGYSTRLGDIANVVKGTIEPALEMTIVDGFPAVVVAARTESAIRVDQWATFAKQELERFQAELSDGIALSVILDQSQYVEQRLNGVLANLILSSLLVVAVSFIILGGKSSLIVGSALPLTTLMVFGCMKALNVPLHQMSVTGLIIAIGLLIDNAIVVVDEVQIRLRQGLHPEQAVNDTVKHLLVPLLASTLTTVLAFVPIAVSPGGTGEFIGTIGLTVILAILGSLFLSLTVIAALVGRLAQWEPLPVLQHGVRWPVLERIYDRSLEIIFRRPWFGVAIAVILPILGFTQASQLEQQFFPPTNRDQFQIEVELPGQTPIDRTREFAVNIRDTLRQRDNINDVQWFLGKSAPTFYYNVIPTRENAPNYAQGIIQLTSTRMIPETIRSLQTELDTTFPEAQILVRQLEQGPPFDAPIELRLYGADIAELRQLSDQLRVELSQIAGVTHTRSALNEARPKLALAVDEIQARRVQLDNQAIGRQLDAALDGTTGGSLLEATEDLPVRVRVTNEKRGDLGNIATLDLLTGSQTLPLDAITDLRVVPDFATITRRDGQRVSNVQAFLEAGTLASSVLSEFEQRLAAIGWELPAGYRLQYGGEADARGSAIGSLLSAVLILAVLMVAVLVLSFNSFGLAAQIGLVGVFAVGLALLALRVFGQLFGFTAILGTLGLVGLAINDSIVVLAALREDPDACLGNWRVTQRIVGKSTRHVIATTVTTIIGFVPLFFDETGFWPPLAIAIAGGLGGATLLALYYIPAVHILLCRGTQRTSRDRELAPTLVEASTKPYV